MKNFTAVLSIIFMTSFFIFAHAEEQNQSLALEYLELSKTKETFSTTIDAYLKKLSSGKNPIANQEELENFFDLYMDWNYLENAFIEIISNSLTQQELKDINNFYKTKSGKAIAEKSNHMATQFSNLFASRLEKTIQEIQAKKP